MRPPPPAQHPANPGDAPRGGASTSPLSLNGPPADHPRKLYTLVVVHQDPLPSSADPAPVQTADGTSPSSTIRRRRVLLGKKLRGFGTGFFNGYGGKVEPGEGVAAAAARELTEEAAIVATDLHRRGVLTFVWVDQPDDPAWEVHVFGCTAFEGEPAETDEMSPAWFEGVEVDGKGTSVTGLPFDRMWADDPQWYPLMLRDGGLFMGAFEFREVTRLVGGGVANVEALPELPR